MESAINKSNVNAIQIISDGQREVIAIVNVVILSSVVSVFGSVANVFNLLVFYKQGLNTTINISFFSLAISDMCSLVLQQLYSLYNNPLFVGLDLPIVYSDVQYLTSGLPRVLFATITCWITAFITAERCLCVVFPLHIKRFITPRITITVIIIINIVNVVLFAPMYFTTYYTWKFYPAQNRTLLCLTHTKDNAISVAFVHFSHAIVLLLGCLIVLIFTLILIYKLGQKNEWRQAANVDLEKAKSISKRDRATIFMVVLIASILVVCYTPAILLSVTTFIEPQFSRFGIHSNLFKSSWSFALLLENVNSSVNILFYFKISTKYRHTFIGMFWKYRTSDKIELVDKK